MESKYQILVFEPDETLRYVFQEVMQTEQFTTVVVATSHEYMKELNKQPFQLCFIDSQGAEFASLQLLKLTKAEKEELPVILAATQPTKEEVAIAYHLGTDDLLRKPYSLDELKARMLAILRRTCRTVQKTSAYYQIGEYLFNNVKRTLTFAGHTHKLTTKETELLHLFCSHPDELIERSYTLRTIWHEESHFSARSMDVYLTKLRQLLRHDPNVSLVNIHGKGYRLKVNKNQVSI